MTPERYKQVDELFQAALERPSEERAVFLDQVCSDDPDLRREVEVLLSSDEQASNLIETPAFALAPELMGNSPSTPLIGRAIGPYRITAHLGSGGMGEVYLAEDSRLGRRVALKLLGRSLVGDAGSRARFLREARLASALDHPNICTVFEVGETNGHCFIAMQYVEGETLNQMLADKPLGLDNMLSISLQIAEALQAAHDRGIIHRDIKPSNIIVTERGQAKVLDFGLARAVEPQGNVREELTGSGVVIGTPAYMSPEQARGAQVDARSDIFSFGVVMYEISTGDVPFKGQSQPETMNALINQPHVPAAEVNKELPIDLSRVIDRALAKDPSHRYQHLEQVISDLSQAAENAGLLHSSASDPVRVRYVASRRPRRPSSSGGRKTFLPVAAVSLVIAMLAFGAYYLLTQRPTTIKVAGPFPELRLTRLTNSGRTTKAVISPDGKYFVHVLENAEGQSLWIRQVEVVTASQQIIPPRHVEYWGLTFSPDGNYVCCVVWESSYAKDVSLYQVPVLGGAAKKLPFQPISQISFSPDGKHIAFYTTRPPGTQLVVANLDETATREIVSLQQPNYFTAIHCSPEWSPDGKTIAAPFSTHDEMGLREAVLAVNPADGSERIITHHGWWAVKNVAWLRDGSGMLATVHEKASLPAQVWHISFPNGEVRRITKDLNHYSGISLTADSRAFVTVQTSTVSSVWVASGGEGAWLSNDLKHSFGDARFRQIASEVGEIPDIAWTREGGLVYVSGASGMGNIWAMGPDGSNPKQLTSDAQAKDSLSVSPDGRYIVFASSRSGALNIWRTDADGSNLKQLTDGNGDLFPNFSRDSRWVVFQRGYGLIPTTLWKVSVDGGEAVQLTETRVQKPRVSPKGELVAYYYLGSDASGESRWSIGVVPFEGGRRVKSFAFPPMVSARLVRWMPNGAGLAYLDNRRGISNIWGQPLNGNQPRQLTDFKTDQIASFDWSIDGRHLVVVRRAEARDAVLIEEVAP